MPSIFSGLNDRPFIILLVAIAILRLFFLLTNQASVHGDEALVGLMAKHIVDKGARPVFCYGCDYNGGAAVTAYLATIFFAIFGMTERALKLIPLLFSLAALSMVYLFVRSARGRRAALFCTVTYSTSIALMKWSFDARGAYMESQILIPLVLWLTREHCLVTPPAHWRNFLLLGFVCGFGFYLLEIFIAVIFTVLLLLYKNNRLFFIGRHFIVFILGVLLGASPLLYYNLTHEWANLHHIAEGEQIPLLLHVGSAPSALWRILTTDLPRVFSYDTLYGFPDQATASSWLEYFILIASAVIVFATHRAELRRFASTLLRRESRRPAPVPSVESILFLYIALYLLLVSMHPLSGNNARYYLFLEPTFSILIGLAFAEIFSAPPSPSRRLIPLGVILVALSLANRAIQLARLASDDGIYGTDGISSPTLAGKIIEELSSRNITRVVVEDYDLRWRILFLSRERVIASNFPGGWSRYPAYETQVARADRLAIVLNARSPIVPQFEQALIARGIFPERIAVADKLLYAPLPQIFMP